MTDLPGPAGTPGLAPQRTALAWQRTALDFVVIGGLLVHAARGHNPIRLAPAAVSLVVGAAVLLTARRRRPGPGATPIRALGAAAIVIALLAAILVLPG